MDSPGAGIIGGRALDDNNQGGEESNFCLWHVDVYVLAETVFSHWTFNGT